MLEMEFEPPSFSGNMWSAWCPILIDVEHPAHLYLWAFKSATISAAVWDPFAPRFRALYRRAAAAHIGRL